LSEIAPGGYLELELAKTAFARLWRLRRESHGARIDHRSMSMDILGNCMQVPRAEYNRGLCFLLLVCFCAGRVPDFFLKKNLDAQAAADRAFFSCMQVRSTGCDMCVYLAGMVTFVFIARLRGSCNGLD
jgi:hypothetical protein